MKRRSHTPKKLRDRRSGKSPHGKSPYAKYNKVPYRYIFKRNEKGTLDHEYFAG